MVLSLQLSQIMSAINLRSVKLEFSQLNYRPDVCHPNLINELKNILEITGKSTIHYFKSIIDKYL